jgi:glycine/D-amino acid oxidase-like deaminating enzyme
MEEKSTDVVIIGAGILGCTAAHELAKRGIEVVLLDAGRIGQGTSTKSFSWINATSKTNNPGYFKMNAQWLNRYLELAKK